MMDPMDYILHNHPRSSGHYDPVHSASSHWMPHSQNSPPYSWQPQNPALPQTYPHHPLQPAPSSGSEPFQLGHHGGMLPPMLAFPPGTFNDDIPGAVSPRPSGRHQTYHRGAMPPPVVATSSGAANHSHDGAFANQLPAARPLSFQPPLGLGMPPAGVGQEPNSLQRPPYIMSDTAANAFVHNANSSHFVPTSLPPHSYISTPPQRRGHFSSASVSSRAFRELPSPTRPSPPSSGFRRSHPRQRRSVSSRMMASDPGRDEDDDISRHLFVDHSLHSPGGSDSSSESMEDALIRHMQVVRGSVSTKMVASKMTLRSLQSIKIEDLSEADRNCVICYNDYGVKTPEGFCEAPLRLPKCGHIFGDHCIKKWFEDSDSCPYCRDKLPSEPKQQHGASARAFMSMMRSQGLHVPPAMAGNPDDLLARALVATYGTTDPNGSQPQHSVTTGRRSPPDDSGERQRRIRPRHSNTNSRESGPFSGVHGRVISLTAPLHRPSPGAPLFESGSRTLPRGGGLSPMTRQRAWASENGQASGPASAASQRNGLPPSAASMSPSAPSFQPQGVYEGSFSRQEPSTGDAASQNSSLPPFRSPLQAQEGVALGAPGNNESAASPTATTPQQTSTTIAQSSRNRPW
ncbi:hypothetical protein ACJZ2D_001845 [Fusarium nematophilum]